MQNTGDPNRVAAALSYLRSRNQFFEFDDQERVVRVSVYNAAQADEIAAHVGCLHDVQKLTFERTDLTDAGLAHLRDLVNVHELSLSSPCLSALALSSLLCMNDLEKLVIHDGCNFDVRTFAHISSFSKLTELSVHDGAFRDQDLAPLAAIDNLQQLSLSHDDNINGTFSAHLTGLPRLRYLNPGEHVTDAGLEEIAKLASLRVLFLEGPFTDKGLQKLRALKELRTLYVTSERITDQGIAVALELPELNELGLQLRDFTDDSASLIARCKSLESILLFQSSLTSAGRKRLREALPDCELHDYEHDRRTQRGEA